MKINIFPWLVNYHHQRNLEEICKPLIVNGRVMVKGKPLQEGSDKNVPYHGFLILVDGPNIVNDLIKFEMINDIKYENGRLNTLLEEYNNSSPISTQDQFFDYLREEEEIGEDGAYIFNSTSGKVVRVSSLNNNPPIPNGLSLSSRIPKDFVHFVNYKDEYIYKLGTKTTVAILTTTAMGKVHAYQIKRTPYTSFGMGKVTHFNRDGLNQEFFFMNTYEGIKGIYRKYENNFLYRTSEKIELSDLSRFDKTHAQLHLEAD